MKRLAIAALLLAAAALSGCTAQAAPAPSPTSLVGQGRVAPAALSEAYHVDGGGQFVNGSRDMCDLLPDDSIIIEDAKSVATFDGSTSVTSMVLSDGQVSYSTIWPNDVVATGIADGTGAYVVNADAAGKPVSITGHATLDWHDKTSNATTHKSDDFTFAITPIARPAYCQPAGG